MPASPQPTPATTWWRRSRRATWRAEAQGRWQRITGLNAAFREGPCPCLEVDRCAKAGGCTCHHELATSIEAHLAVAEAALDDDRFLDRKGTAWTATWNSLDEAEAQLLRLAPDSYVIGELPAMLAFARSHLRPGDERLQRIVELATYYAPAPPQPKPVPALESEVSWFWRARKRLSATMAPAPADRGAVKLTTVDREAVAATFTAAALERLRAVVRVRSFRDILYAAALALAILAGALTTVTAISPQLLPLCFTPDNTAVCPTRTGPDDGAIALARTLAGGEAALENVLPLTTATPSNTNAPTTATPSSTSPSPEAALAINHAEVLDRVVRETATSWDVALIELIGALAAAVSGAFALRAIDGTATPYSLPVALAVLKVPAGALTAVLGLLLLRGEFVPGFSNLDSSAQIVAWAIIFGGAQQLVTRLIDRRAETVLDKVGAPGTAKAPDGTTVKIGDTSSGA